MNTMDIHHLRVFASVFRNRSFSRAAEELHLTQPTVSDHIRTLEEELNCKLFDRLARKIIPTREAEGLYNRAIEIIEKTEGISDMFGRFKQDIAGALIIGASTIPGTYILPVMLASFRRLHPLVSFEIPISDTKGIIEKILNHELLVGVVGTKLGAGQMQYHQFMEDEMIVISPPALIDKNTVTLKELAALPMIMREEGSGTRREFEKILEGKNINLEQTKIAGVLGSTDAVKQAVKEGLGISIVSRRSVSDELKCGSLKEIRIKDISMRRHFYIATHRKRTLPHLYKTFFEFLIERQANSKD